MSFYFFSNQIARYRFHKKYKHLNSQPNDFDWVAYSMKNEDGRIRNDNPNGSIANISVKNTKITIILKHNNRKWTGEVQMIQSNFGTLIFKYENEFGKRDCAIGFYSEIGKIYDYLFFTPIHNRIYAMKPTDDGIIPKYEYDDEILIRERDKK
ncbi:MAG: hypothetical protein ACHQF0_01835 [Chitinophagales bacterium]